jgi:histidine kinase
MKIKFQDDLPGRQGLGKTLFQLGKYTEAKDIFETILKEHPDDIEAKWTLSQVFSKEGDYDSAKKLLSNISSTDLASRGLELFDIEKRISDLGKRIIEQDAELERTRTLAYLGTMATATAHELNQPIGIIRAITDAALNDIRDGFIKEKEIPSLLKKILMQTDRLAGRIENLRAFARSDRTKREKVMLNNLLEQMGQMFFEQFKHRNIILEIETDKTRNAPIVWANPVQIEEVLINLITNARDAVEGLPKAWVKVRCWRDKYGGSWFTVEDNGPGLNQEYRKQIFTPFVSTKSTEKGTGLGLYISRRLISELGGRLNYEDRLTKGAKFIVYLPPIKEN